MEFAVVAVRIILPKLSNLVIGEYKLHKEVRGDIRFLQSELETIHAFLLKVSDVPADQLDGQVKTWARAVRELSYDIEDRLNDFTELETHVPSTKEHGFKELLDRCKNLVAKISAGHQIATEIKKIMKDVVELAEQHKRYKLDATICKPSEMVDPRMLSFFQEAKHLVGTEGPRDDVMKALTAKGHCAASVGRLKIVSIVGFGGLGKTALAKLLYDEMIRGFDCHAFVSVSLKPDIKKILKNIFLGVNRWSSDFEAWDVKQLIDETRLFLQDKRYLIVIDDIWDSSAWDIIKCSLVDNGNGSKIILTTRKDEVAEYVGGVYRMKPLSGENSEKLFYRRIFGCEKRCPSELKDVGNEILKKCGGIPLAIITIASLLAKRPETESAWRNLHAYIGCGIDNDQKMHDMRRILSLSYYDLPAELRICLLYLSIYPEDYVISKDSLIWKWISEGFIQKKQEQSLQDVAESYFNELVNRSLVEAIGEDQGMSGRIKACRVHDIVLEFLTSISTQENFTTSFDGQHYTVLPKKTRYLSIQNSIDKNNNSDGIMNLDSVRSFTLFAHGNLIPPLDRFCVLRVCELNLEGCTFIESYDLKKVGRLLHLRYLALSGTSIKQLPKGIVKLKFLEALDIRGTSIFEIPTNIIQLRQLKRLFVNCMRLPDGIGKMKCIEELSHFGVESASTSLMKELGDLSELRVLHVNFESCNEDNHAKGLLEALHNLGKNKIQDLVVACGGCPGDFMLDSWWVPPKLKTFSTYSARFTAFPTWIFSHCTLSILSIEIIRVTQMDIQMLGGSPALTQVYLLAKHDPEEPLVIGNGGFHCLTHFSLRCRGEFPKGVTFAPGAMKNLQMLELICVLPWRAEEPNGGLNLGLENLPSLRHLLLGTNCSYMPQSHVEALEAATRKATDSHPNHATLKTGLLGTTRRKFFPKYVKYQGYESFTSDATVHDPSSLSFCHITTTGTWVLAAAVVLFTAWLWKHMNWTDE